MEQLNISVSLSTIKQSLKLLGITSKVCVHISTFAQCSHLASFPKWLLSVVRNAINHFYGKLVRNLHGNSSLLMKVLWTCWLHIAQWATLSKGNMWGYKVTSNAVISEYFGHTLHSSLTVPAGILFFLWLQWTAYYIFRLSVDPSMERHSWCGLRTSLNTWIHTQSWRVFLLLCYPLCWGDSGDVQWTVCVTIVLMGSRPQPSNPCPRCISTPSP